jgi:proline iminopeptidase
MKIYVHMQGYSEFVVTGNLKGWDSWDRLHQIAIPALMIGAENDEMDPKDMKKMADMVPKGTFGFVPEGSHMAFWDGQEAYFEHLLAFLRSL